MEFVKFFQAYFIDQDITMYYAAMDKPAQVGWWCHADTPFVNDRVPFVCVSLTGSNVEPQRMFRIRLRAVSLLFLLCGDHRAS